MTSNISPPPCYQKPTGKLFLDTADQLNLVNGVLTLVNLNAISANFNDAIEDTGNHRIAPGKQGFYSIKGQVTFKNTVVDKSYYAEISLITNPVLVCGHEHSSIAGEDVTVSLCADVFLDAEQIINLEAVSNSGDDTVDIRFGEYETFLSIQRTR